MTTDFAMILGSWVALLVGVAAIEWRRAYLRRRAQRQRTLWRLDQVTAERRARLIAMQPRHPLSHEMRRRAALRDKLRGPWQDGI
jgi:hypothetical protein